MLRVPTLYTMPSRLDTDCLTEHVVGIYDPRGRMKTDDILDYGNEKEAGEGVARAIKDGLVKREDLFIVSKLWNTFHEGHQVEPIVKKQLADWGVDYFDLFYIHFPVALKYVDPSVRYPPGWEYDGKEVIPIGAPIQETWTALEAVVEKKLARSIGISNFQGSLILDMLRYAKVKPAVLQIEHHPYLVQPTLLKLAEAEGIAVTAYSSFGPQSFVELGWDKAKDTPVLFEHPVVTKIAEKHGKTAAQVLLRWSTQRGLAVIPKSNSQNRLQQNLEVTSFDLDKSEIEAISGLDKGLRFNNPTDVSSSTIHPLMELMLILPSISVHYTSSLRLKFTCMLDDISLTRCVALLGLKNSLLCSILIPRNWLQQRFGR